jgi:putative oxidoreductase
VSRCRSLAKIELFKKVIVAPNNFLAWVARLTGGLADQGCGGRRVPTLTTRREKGGVMIDILFNGVGWPDLALTLNRIAVGIFFMLSGYHKLFNASRHRVLINELEALGIPAVRVNQWWVPTVEFSAGAAVAVGLLAPLAALGLLIITLVAMATSGRQKIKDYKPIDRADRVDDWLYLPETLYAVMLAVVVSAGAGPYSLDAVIQGMIGK